MRYRFAKLGRRAILATSPDTSVATGAFGNAILNVAWSFCMARETGAMLCIEPTDGHRHVPLCRLECAAVSVVACDSVAGRRFALAFHAADALSPLLGMWSGYVRVDGPREPPPRAREPRYYFPVFGLNFRRLVGERPLQVQLAREDRDAAERLAAEIGLRSDSRIVTVHVREGGYKSGQGLSDRDKDVVRNARIDTYLPAIDWLVAQGYTVVRIGDPSMTPIARPGVIDLATSGRSSQALDLWCVQRSAFFVATDSGPFNLSLLIDVPCLATNVTHFLGAYPLRSADRYLLRHVHDAESGRELPLDEMLTPDHLKHRYVPSRVTFRENTPEEIRAAVEEMANRVASPTAAQQAVRTRIAAFLETDYGRRKLKLSATGATEPYYLGRGWVSAVCAPSLAGAGTIPGGIAAATPN